MKKEISYSNFLVKLRKMECLKEESTSSYWMNNSIFTASFKFKDSNIMILTGVNESGKIFVIFEEDFFILPQEQAFEKLMNQPYYYEILTTLDWLFK